MAALEVTPRPSGDTGVKAGTWRFINAGPVHAFLKPIPKTHLSQRCWNADRSRFLVHSQTRGGLSMNASRIRRAAIYARVSTSSQTTENQLRELRQVAERHGWRVVAEFTDNGVSGAKGRNAPPGLDQLMPAVARREIDMVLALVGRSVPPRSGRLARRAARQAGRSLPASAGPRHINAGRQGAVSDDGRIRGVRAGHDPGARQRWPCARQGEWREARPTDRRAER